MSYATLHTQPPTAKAFYWTHLGRSSPSDIMTIECQGVPGGTVKSLAEKLSLTTARFAQITGAPKATLEHKAANGTLITGGSA